MKKWIQSICQNSCQISWHWSICSGSGWLLAHSSWVDSSLNRPCRMSVSFFSFGTKGSIIGINILGTLSKVPWRLLLLAFVHTKILLQLFLHFSHLVLTTSSDMNQCMITKVAWFIVIVMPVLPPSFVPLFPLLHFVQQHPRWNFFFKIFS